MIRIDKREAARRDLIEHYIYLAESGGTELADRFLRQAEASFEGLGRQPLMGAPLHLEHPALRSVRKWRVKGFDNHLVFYEPRDDGISVVRVLHAASDWWALLGIAD